MNLLRAWIIASSCGLFFLPHSASADVAVLLQLTHHDITVERIRRRAPGVVEQSRVAVRKIRGGAGFSAFEAGSSVGFVQLAWYGADGQLVHTELKPDPRFTHAPGGQDVAFPSAILRAKGPSSAIRLDIRPSGFTDFLPVDVTKSYPND